MIRLVCQIFHLRDGYILVNSGFTLFITAIRRESDHCGLFLMVATTFLKGYLITTLEYSGLNRLSTSLLLIAACFPLMVVLQS